jgi:sugar phosphate permease
MEIYKTYPYRWVILAAYMFLAALSQLFWLNFTAIDTYIENNLHISAMSTGLLALVFPLVYLLISIPAGIIIDKKGFKYGIGIGILFTGVFGLIRLINPASYPLLLLSQIGIAIGQPFILNGITKLVVVWFAKREEATAVGLGSLAMFIGMIVAVGVTPFLVESLGYFAMLLIYSLLGAVGILIFFLLVRSHPPTPSRAGLPDETIPVREGLKNILKMRDFIILGFIALIGIGVFNGLATWLEKLLNELHHISMVDAGTISALMIFSGILGCIVIPLLSDKIQKRKPFLILASLVGAISLIILMLQTSFIGHIGNSIILGFFLLSALPIMLTMSIEITGEKYAGISVAYLQLLGNGAAVIIVPVMEFLRGASGNYILPLAFLVILLLIASIMSVRIKDTGKALESEITARVRDTINK